jgi:hypothetical protein
MESEINLSLDHASTMNEEHGSQFSLSACHRCHASKLRCIRDNGKQRCKRCIKAKVECISRPSKRNQNSRNLRSPSIFSPLSETSSTPMAPPAPTSFPTTSGSTDGPQSGTLDVVESSLCTAFLGMSDAFDSEERLHCASYSKADELQTPELIDFSHNFEILFPGSRVSENHTSEEDTQSPTHVELYTPINDYGNKFYDFLLDQDHSQLTTAANLSCLAMQPRLVEHTNDKANTCTEDWTYELATLNSVLLGHQKAMSSLISTSNLAFQSTPLTNKDQGRHLPVDETLRIGLRLSSLLHNLHSVGSEPPSQSSVSNDQATIALIVSCYTRLTSVFQELCGCLQPIFERCVSKTTPQETCPSQESDPFSASLSLLPPVKLGSLFLGAGEPRLQATVVLDACERVLKDIAAYIEMVLDSESKGKGYKALESTAGEVTRALAGLVKSEQAVVSERARKLRDIMS